MTVQITEMREKKEFFLSGAWEFHNPVQIFSGRGSRVRLLEELNQRKLLVVTTQRGREQFSSDRVLSSVLRNNQIIWIDSVIENPGLTDLQIEIDRLQNEKIDVVVAFGGGSSMDAAKVVRIALTDSCKGYSLEELLLKPGLHRDAAPVPLYAIPTTAGTGSEVTPFATVWHHEVRKKLSLAGPQVFPTVACIDAELMDSLPIDVTISTGLDAINQAAESVWNKNANSITLSYAYQALELGLCALPALASGIGGKAERDKMAEASLLAGLAISHTRTALCHSISYPITAHFGVPHGLACAFTMPAVFSHNVNVDDGRFTNLALSLTGNTDVRVLHSIFEELNGKLNVRERVKSYVDEIDSLLALKKEMFDPTRSVNNLRETDFYDLCVILRSSWG